MVGFNIGQWEIILSWKSITKRQFNELAGIFLGHDFARVSKLPYFFCWEERNVSLISKLSHSCWSVGGLVSDHRAYSSLHVSFRVKMLGLFVES